MSPSPSSGLAATPSDSSLHERITLLEQETQKLKKQQKDVWDKLAAISGLISGGVVVLLGLLVTYVVNERNRTTAEQQKKRELAVLQAQTVQSFMPQLQAGGKEQEVALTAIFALDADLGLSLATLYGTDSSVDALRKMAASPDPAYAKLAQQSLENIITVSLKEFSPDLDDLRLSASSLRTFYDLTNQVFWGLKGTVKPFTYETSWILRDQKSGQEFMKQRTTDGDVVRFDLRSVKEVGIEAGMALEAVPVNDKNLNPPNNSST
jgi:hypothetical protein